MIEIGRGIRWYNSYQDEVDFCNKHGFDFMQIWFKDGKMLINDIYEPKEEYIKSVGFPIIIHAVFDPIDFETYGDKLLELVEYLGHKEVIIHPVSEKTPVTIHTESLLVSQMCKFSQKAKNKGIIWYLENNSVVDEFHYTCDQLKLVYDTDNYVEQLLDIAHIDNYEHLKQIIDVKFPKCLHVAGKHFDIPHEHLPITKGDVNYKFVFETYLQSYNGRIILEVDGTDEEIKISKQIIDDAILNIRTNIK